MQHLKPLVRIARWLPALGMLLTVSCQSLDIPRGEYLIVSGAPALRRWENLRVPTERHDRYAGNFIKAADIRMKQLRQLSRPGTTVTWLVYRPGYLTRQREDVTLEAATPCPVSEIEARAAACGARLRWFTTRADLVEYLNRHEPKSLAGLEYFGHSNRYAFLFDYSNEISGASSCYLHVCDLALIQRGLFARGAHIQSWGCFTSDPGSGRYGMSKVWKRQTGHAMKGAVGKTDYSPISDNHSLPSVDPALGWKQ